MTRIYLGDLRDADGIARRIRGDGFELVAESTPDDPEAGALSLVRAEAGITSALRHRLNNPLTAVLGFAELLLRGPALGEEAERKVLQIQENALRLREMLLQTREADA
jgi:signal transduction histidine kinase